MRLAEFKMRLFVFFAYRFLKWAGLSESPDLPVANPQHNPANDADRSAGPPEHWRRLFSAGPPEHWLDLFRVKSVELPPATLQNQERVETPVTSSEFESKTDALAQPPVVRVHQKQGRNVATYSHSERQAWLNRLRFFPAPVHIETRLDIPKAEAGRQSQASYVRREVRNKTSDPRFAEKISFKRTADATTHDAARISNAETNEAVYVRSGSRDRSDGSFVDYKNPAFSPAIQQMMYEDADRATSETELTFSAPVSRSIEDANPRFDESRKAAGDTGEGNYVASRRTGRTSSLQLDSHVSTSLNELDVVSPHGSSRESTLETVKYENLRNGRQLSAFVEWPRLSRQNRFNEIESRRRTSAPEIFFDDSSNRWPRLPDRPMFELADELFARNDEIEALRRLEREQSGKRWNE